MPPIVVPFSAKRIATQILVIAKLNRREVVLKKGCLVLRDCVRIEITYSTET